MEVTSENFSDELPSIVDAIRNSSFLSFDCEFSGLGHGGAAISAYETPELLYHKWKSNVSNFMIMQFGLCAFKYDPEEQEFIYTCYSFYVFPRLPQGMRGLRNLVSQQLTNSIQADCLDFLAGQNFDFNKWICKGVGYLRSRDIDRLIEEIKRKHGWRSANSQASFNGSQTPNIPDAMKPKINQILKRVQTYIERGKPVEDSGQTETNEDGESGLRIPGLTAFERKMVYQTLEHKYGMQLYVEGVSENKSDNNDITLIVRKCLTKEEHESMRKEKLNAELDLLSQAVGFSQVITEITKSGKPMIGHNLTLDLFHTYRAFCGDLPPSWRQFKNLVREYFPVVIDTKVLALQKPLKAVVGSNSSLRELLNVVKEKNFPKVTCRPTSESRGFKEDNQMDLDQLHNAGFDAYATGKLFLALATYFGDYKDPQRKTKDVPWDLLRPFTNKLMTGKVQDMPYLSLSSDDELSDRSHVFFLRTNNDQWTSKEIYALFSPYGPVQIYWVYNPRNSAFVTLTKKNNAGLVMKALKKTQESDKSAKWRIQTAADFLASQETDLIGPSCHCATEATVQAGTKRAGHQEPMDISDEDTTGSVKKVSKTKN